MLLKENEKIISGTLFRNAAGVVGLVPSQHLKQTEDERLSKMFVTSLGEKSIDLDREFFRRGADPAAFSAVSGTFLFRDEAIIDALILSDYAAGKAWTSRIEEEAASRFLPEAYGEPLADPEAEHSPEP